MIAALLKDKTTSRHRLLEKEMYVDEIFNKSLTLQQYKNLLLTNYLVHTVLENKVYNVLPESLQDALAIASRKKVAALQNDIINLEMNTLVIDSSDIALPDFSDTTELLAAVYVLEGSALVGNIIAKQLKQVPALRHLSFFYYTFYGEELSTKWKEFLTVLNSAVLPENYEACIQKANETFDFIGAVARKVKSLYN